VSEWWRTIKISIPEGDKTLHFDTIWILKGKNAAQLNFVVLVFNVVWRALQQSQIK
jgi:hypothetical protein